MECKTEEEQTNEQIKVLPKLEEEQNETYEMQKVWERRQKIICGKGQPLYKNTKMKNLQSKIEGSSEDEINLEIATALECT